MRVVKTTSDDPEFIALVKQLDADLAVTDGDEHAFYDQYNKLDHINYVLVGYINDKAIACGAIKKYNDVTVEIKRMYTLPLERGKGHAVKILLELEAWASQLKFKKCILETGTRQPYAIALYKKCGYKIIENYGQYKGVKNSVCFEKNLFPKDQSK
ncbi:GNAT family N-acetyltransferase [Cochleicola gelatinilyticus]|uniref:GNAT family acetyltransferase n=1 Tax=Cochleicola gelatinilyticus TaxID=1763537 RepID=A0A167JB39_9FLAO|nr:GNAT family N-acetyltransferase [Cochleicola gelatinilyticus]OAB80505.1 GNAT family acetyltransferase [Cochleicola gelatinilyticus]